MTIFFNPARVKKKDKFEKWTPETLGTYGMQGSEPPFHSLGADIRLLEPHFDAHQGQIMIIKSKSKEKKKRPWV